MLYQRVLGTKRYDGQGVRVNNSLNADEKKMTFTRSHLGAVLGGTTGAMSCYEMLDVHPYVVGGCTILGALQVVTYCMIVITIYIMQYLLTT